MTATLPDAPRVTAGNNLVIEAPDGEPHAYLVSRADAGLDLWACTVERAAEAGHGPYRVALTARGRWTCGCDAFHYSKKPKACKHTREVARLHALMSRLMPGGVNDAPAR